METIDIFWQLLIVIAGVKLAGDLSVRLGQPSVLGKLIVGVILGPALLNIVHTSEMIESFSQIGVVFLMFFAGLETSIEDLNKNRNVAILAAIGGIIFPLIGLYTVGVLFGLDFKYAVFLGLVFSATSVSISVQTFRELGQLKSKESTVVLGAALVDDIVVVIMLALATSLMLPSANDHGIWFVISKKIVFFASVFLFAKIIPYFIKFMSKLKVTEAVMSGAIIVCFFLAYLAEYFGLAGIIGSFATGLIISRTPYKKVIEKKLEPLAYTIFVPVFFVSIGLSVSFRGLLNNIWFIIVLIFMAIITKIIGAGLGTRLLGNSWRSAFIVGAGMVSRGEVALIIALLGLNYGLLPEKYYTPVIIVIIFSTIITPPLLKYLLKTKVKG